MSCSSPADWSTSSSARLRLAALLLGALLALTVACGGGKSSATPTPGSESIKSTPATSSTASNSTTPTQTSGGAPSDETVRFATASGRTIEGHLYAAPGAKRRLVIIAVPAPEAEAAWQPFARELASGGVAALTVQMPLYMDPPGNGATSPAEMDTDLQAAVGFMESRDYPLIYVIGVWTEGTAALKLAARHDLAGVVTVSSPTSFGGLDARADIANVGAAKLFIASRGDSNGATALGTFVQSAKDPKQSQLFDGMAHGTELITGANAAAFKQTIKDFLTK